MARTIHHECTSSENDYLPGSTHNTSARRLEDVRVHLSNIPYVAIEFLLLS